MFGVVPKPLWGRRIASDERNRIPLALRCLLVEADFFAAAAGDGFDPGRPDARHDAVLLDIDHSPSHWLAPAHASFYSEAGLATLAAGARCSGRWRRGRGRRRRSHRCRRGHGRRRSRPA